MRVDEQSCLDEQLLLFMDQLEALEEKRHKLNSLIEEVRELLTYVPRVKKNESS